MGKGHLALRRGQGATLIPLSSSAVDDLPSESPDLAVEGPVGIPDKEPVQDGSAWGMDLTARSICSGVTG